MGLEEADMPIEGRECAKACKRSCVIPMELYKVWPEQEGWGLVGAKFEGWAGANHEGPWVSSYRFGFYFKSDREL